MKKVFVAITIAFALAFNAFSLDFAFRITPNMVFPRDEELGSGFGGVLNADVDLFNLFTVGIEGGYSSVKQKSLEKNFNIFMGGASAGVYYYPLSRLYVSANGSYGIYKAEIDSPSVVDSGSGSYWRAFFEAGFRFNPSIIFNAVGGYEKLSLDGDDFISTPFAGLGAKFNFSFGKKSSSSSAFMVTFEQDAPVYPVFANLYKQAQMGLATVRNMSGAEVRDVHVSFRAGKYTSAAKECASVSVLNRYKSLEVPIMADFSQEFLRFSEDGKINGELVISYKYLGKQVTEVQNIVIDVLHRNSFSWLDSAALASFVDTGCPEILEVSKYIAGAEIINLKPGLNSPFQYAAAIMEGLRLGGIVYSEDTLTPYTKFRNGEETDSVQFPLQTLSLMSGDYDDIGILVCSCLESFGIVTGFAALNDDFIVLVDTGIAPEKKTNQFADEDVVSDENTTWLALSMKNFSKGFTESRLGGAKRLNAALKNQEDSEDSEILVNVHAAWEVYPPVTFTGYKGAYKNPPKDSIVKAVNDATSYYINHDLASLIKKFRKNGDTKRLADCYVRAGMYNEALAEYQKLGTVAAYNNMGMIYVSQKNYRSARAMYEKALSKSPENATALAGLKKIKALSGE